MNYSLNVFAIQGKIPCVTVSEGVQDAGLFFFSCCAFVWDKQNRLLCTGKLRIKISEAIFNLFEQEINH